MNKFNNLMAECEYLKTARGYGILEAIMFINEYEYEYPSEIRRELKEFCRDGARTFAQAQMKEAV
ncbi:MAG: hypothetical protein EBU08_05840 [Micrococcales bacterium]|nr:hypothetical protein [Micrococcales bacterium]